MRHLIRFILIPASLLWIGGCTVHPAGESAQRQAALRAGAPYQKRDVDRRIQPLPASPAADDLVRYALLNNADLERRFWEWRSAIEQIPQDGTPETTLAISAATGITRGRSVLADTVVTAQNMPSMMIPWPGKLSAAARRALENARAAGWRFRKAQFDLREKVFAAWDDYALNAELIRLEQTNAELLQTTVMVAEARNRAGSSQLETLKSLNELDLSRNEILARQAQLPTERAAINALLSRSPEAAIPVPGELPPRKPVKETDGQLLALAARQNPQLAALARQIAARQDGLELARLQYYPDFAAGFGTDLAGITQTISGMVSVPLLRNEAIHAAISQAQANLLAGEAMRRQAGNDLAAQVVMDITIIRDADRQLDLFDHAILPRARQIVDIGRSAYETSRASLLDLLDDQRSLIAIERLVANLKITREKHVAELESITACDL